MLRLNPLQITPAISSLFDGTWFTMPRAFNVLEGSTCGQILTDDLNHPTWAAIRENAFADYILNGE